MYYILTEEFERYISTSNGLNISYNQFLSFKVIEKQLNKSIEMLISYHKVSNITIKMRSTFITTPLLNH